MLIIQSELHCIFPSPSSQAPSICILPFIWHRISKQTIKVRRITFLIFTLYSLLLNLISIYFYKPDENTKDFELSGAKYNQI
jgi:hypothetical protein